MTTTDRYGPTALLTPANGLTIGRLLLTPVFIALIVTRGATWLTAANALLVVLLWFVAQHDDHLALDVGALIVVVVIYRAP